MSSQIALHVLVTHLLSKSDSQAAIIDTTGTFDVLRLYQIIAYRIKSKQAADIAAATSNVNPKIFHADPNANNLDATASQVLDRVKIMRVFDFVGVSEAISELRDDIRNAEKDQQSAAAWAAEPTQMTHVADSQADEGGEDIMLFDDASDSETISSLKLEPVGLVIIDNITSSVSPVLKSSYVQGRSDLTMFSDRFAYMKTGQAILTSFLRSLSRFSEDSNVASILINNAATTRQTHLSFHGLAQLNRSEHLPQVTFVDDPLGGLKPNFLDQASIFASTTAQPSLGKTFTSLVDCHVLLSTLPKRKKDAEILVGCKGGNAEVVNVLEVLSEKGCDGQGRWAAFETAGAGTQLKTPS